MPPAIQACVRCAGRDFRTPGIRDGLLPQTDNLGDWVCRRCGWRGVPLEFPERSDFEAFRDSLQQAGG